MALTLTAVTPTVIGTDGGKKLTLTGVFPINAPLSVYVGPNDNASDPACYSGVPGNGFSCYALTSGLLIAFSPVLTPGLARYDITIVSPSTGEQVTLATALTVRHPWYYSQVFALRSVLPPTWYVGPRNLEAEPPP